MNNFEDMFGGMFGGKPTGENTKVNPAHENVGRKFFDDKMVIHISTGHVDGELHRCYCIHDKEKKEVFKHAHHWMTK